MQKLNYFFRRREFTTPNIPKSYYEYLGYFQEPEENRSSSSERHYPILLYFGRDELSFYYHDRNDGKIRKVFHIYVADGELNQQILTKKIENYWKMPLWTPTAAGCDSTEAAGHDRRPFQIDAALCSASFFSNLYGFALETGESGGYRFKPKKLFRERENRHVYVSDKGLEFHYDAGKGGDLHIDSWKITKHENSKDEIYSVFIDFRKLLLDFLYELDFATTFEDENFYKLQAVLQNNKLLDALSRRCLYLDKLSNIQTHRFEEKSRELPKDFLNAEGAWLNVCFQENYLQEFTSVDSVFDTVEEEVERVLFKAVIGKAKRRRIKCFTRENSEVRDRAARLRNQAATFFLRRYSLHNAIKTLLPPWGAAIGIFALLLAGSGDFLLSHELHSSNWTGICGFGIPISTLLFLMFHFWRTGINLFKLIMPRLFLGIMMGWAVFWDSEESWKAAVTGHMGKTVVVDVVLLTIISIYIFTDIRNKLVKIRSRGVLARSVCLLLFAMLISFVQGFYVLQFKAQPILENSGFLNHNNARLLGLKSENNSLVKQYDGRLEILGEQKPLRILGFELNNFEKIKIAGLQNYFYYIWSIHLSQFVMAILIGVILQLLWEDRPITEPL